jgi:hypothetical protein
MKRTRKVTPKGPQPVRLEKITTTVNGANRTLTVGRELTLHKERQSVRGGRYRLTAIEREVSGGLLLIVFGPLSSAKPKQLCVRAGDVAAIHVKPKKARPKVVAPEPVPEPENFCDNCLTPLPLGRSDCGMCRD